MVAKAFFQSAIARLLVLFVGLGMCVGRAAAGEGVPAFAVTPPGGPTSILMGSMHFPYPALRQPALSILKGVRYFIIEHETGRDDFDVTPAPEVVEAQQVGIPRFADWAAVLTLADIARIHLFVGCSLPREVVHERIMEALKAQSPKLAAALAFYPCVPPGLPSRDALIAAEAKARGIERVSLETREEIARQRRKITKQMDLATLQAGMSMDLQALYDELAAAFNEGNFAKVAEMSSSVYPDPADRIFSHRVMVTDRNVAWLAKLQVLLPRGKALVLVGAAHLPGDDGLVALLRRAGYRVEPITVPAAASR